MLRGFSRRLLFTGLLLIGLHGYVHAFDSAAVEIARGNQTDVLRIGTNWEWKEGWLRSNNTSLGGYWELSAAFWRLNRFQNLVGNSHGLVDFGATPVFRFQRSDSLGWYAEGGIGLHYLSENYDNNGRQLSGNFQFGSHLGVGYSFACGVDVGIKLRHVSNGGIRKPNDGVNFVAAAISYRF
jgi:lipid A 3-O-deacylase